MVQCYTMIEIENPQKNSKPMVVTITALKLRSLWGFFRLSWHGLQIVRQMKQQQGFLEMKNTGFGYWHYTLSAWENEAAIKPFAHSGAHLQALKQSKRLATEIVIYTFECDQLPSWPQAKQLLQEHGRTIRY